MLQFLRGLKDMGGSAIGVLDELGFGSERRRRSILSLVATVEAFGEALSGSRAEWGAMEAHIKESEIFISTLQNQLVLLWNDLRKISITLGNSLLPIMRDFVVLIRETVIPVISSVADGFNALPEGIQKGILAVTALTAAIGPLIVAASMVMSVLGPAFMAIFKGHPMLKHLEGGKDLAKGAQGAVKTKMIKEGFASLAIVGVKALGSIGKMAGALAIKLAVASYALDGLVALYDLILAKDAQFNRESFWANAKRKWHEIRMEIEAWNIDAYKQLGGTEEYQQRRLDKYSEHASALVDIQNEIRGLHEPGLEGPPESAAGTGDEMPGWMKSLFDSLEELETGTAAALSAWEEFKRAFFGQPSPEDILQYDMLLRLMEELGDEGIKSNMAAIARYAREFADAGGDAAKALSLIHI